MARAVYRDPDLEWLDHIRPVGLVVAPRLIKHLGLVPSPQTAADNGLIKDLIHDDPDTPALGDPWTFVRDVLGWEAHLVAGAPGGPPLPDALSVPVTEQATVLTPTWAVGTGEGDWRLLVCVEQAGVGPDARASLDGWEATPHQRFERLLRETGVFAGLLVTEGKDKAGSYCPELRLIYAPKGETSGWLAFPIRPMREIAGRPMLGGLKLLLDQFRLFSDAEDRRLPALLARSRAAQDQVSEQLAGQVLGALYELLRGLDDAEAGAPAGVPRLIRDLARHDPDHLYDGLLAALMRLVFILYAEDRELLPSLPDARELYEKNYSVRGLYADLVEAAGLNPDTMDERQGGWGRLLALFRLIHSGHRSGFIQARRGKLFDPDAWSFLEGRRENSDPSRVLKVSDGCLLRVLEGLMTLAGPGGVRERLSYRTLDVEQIGSVYETVMGFESATAAGESLAIKAGKNNRTPVFLDLDALSVLSGKARTRQIKDIAGRTLTTAQAVPVEVAKSIAELAAALGSFVDPRASPQARLTPSGAPILQPTDERRRTGSHYTPRSLTAPIVQHALEPALARLGPDATADEVLDLKICDPAMGSGAFLVEACRVIAERLVKAWDRWKTRPPIPDGEDENIFARRLVAQHCLYGVDKNPRAVDLAKLSLWLATLAESHEFTFLDHALKCGDSLVGLDLTQIEATHWDRSQAPTFVGHQVRQHLAQAEAGRIEVRDLAEGATEAELRPMLKRAEAKLEVARLIGDGVIAAFFSAAKPRPRVQRLVQFQQDVLAGGNWAIRARAFGETLRAGEHPIPPFHWPVEFPEVFSRGNPGFDVIVGNPPFAGKNNLIDGNRAYYLPWLQTLHEDAHGNADLVVHFFRRAFGLLRQGGVFGLIATNTIGQGDTRASGLQPILSGGGAISRATRRLKWPGEAAVVVSVVHVAKGEASVPMLDGRPVCRISAFLVEGDLDTSPAPLAANAGDAFIGSYVLGMGFTFDDTAAANGEASSLAEMRTLIERDPHNGKRILPYIGGDEVNTDPRHAHHRFVIDFANFPLCRRADLGSWLELDKHARAACRAEGFVPEDYPDPVAEDWPDLLRIVQQFVKPERDKLSDNSDGRRRRRFWWLYGRAPIGLYRAIAPLGRVFVVSRVTEHLAIVSLTSGQVYADRLVVFASENFAFFSTLQSRIHEVWVRAFSATMADTLMYAPSDCFRTFPFPRAFTTNRHLKAAGEAYHTYRAALMIERSEGLTKTYNRFHARGERGDDIARLRELHADMDRAVLAAYGWDDLATHAPPEFIDQEADEGKTPKTRLDWPPEFKDEVLARLLAVNAARATEERRAGLVATQEEDDQEGDEASA
jgi:hypothetical protein